MTRFTIALVAATLAAGPTLASEPVDAMAAFVRAQTQAWVATPAVIEALRAQNVETASLTQADIDAMDQDWRNEVGQADQPLIASVTSNPASLHLRDRVSAAQGMITEVFVMDARGLNVATSAVTSDYWQGDEVKFQETFPKGPGAVHVSEVEFDESTQTYQAQVSLSIADPQSGEVIGAVTFGINAQAFF